MGSIFLSDFLCPSARFEKSQDDGMSWLRGAYRHYQKSHTSTEEDYSRLLKRVGVNPAQISKRGYYLPDFHSSREESTIFKPTEVLGLSARQKEYFAITQKIFRDSNKS